MNHGPERRLLNDDRARCGGKRRLGKGFYCRHNMTRGGSSPMATLGRGEKGMICPKAKGLCPTKNRPVP